MQTLKEVKIEMYDNMKNRYNGFLSEEERYIVENLKSCIYQNNELHTIYTEEQACDVICQSLDWIDTSDIESAMWEAWYIRWYEVALIELKNDLQHNYDNHTENINDVIEWLNYLLIY